jgi:hypothetical protein
VSRLPHRVQARGEEEEDGFIQDDTNPAGLQVGLAQKRWPVTAQVEVLRSLA